MTVADLRPALRAFLLADADIYNVVGGERIYAVQLPQGQTQASLVYHRISNRGDHHMEGPSGLSSPRIQIDAWAADQDAADELARFVKTRLDGFRGEMEWGSGSPPDKVVVQGVFFDSERNDFHTDAALFRVSQDYMIWFEER